MQVKSFRRRLTSRADPFALFSHLALDEEGGARPGVAFFETARLHSGEAPRARLCVEAALKLSCRGEEVTLEPCTDDARAFLDAHPELNSSREVSLPESRGRDDDEDRDRLRAPGVLDRVRRLLGLSTTAGEGGPPLFCTFAYDLFDHFEALPPARDDAPRCEDLSAVLPAALVDVDPVTGATVASTFALGSDAAAERIALGRLQELVERIEGYAGRAPAAVAPVEPGLAEAEVDLSDEEYGAVVERAKEHIFAGDVFQIVPSRRFTLPCPRPARAFTALRQREQAPYRFFYGLEEGVLFGASPERAVGVTAGADGPPEVSLTPIAGTRPRGQSDDGRPAEDRDDRLHLDLMLDEKERAEHLMLIDLARNDVARVSRPGTRHVARLLEVEKLAHVMHLVSEVRGELDDGLDALHVLRVGMHAGTLVGAPKVRAAALLRELEPGRRGLYGGAVGVLEPSGALETAIVIRSAFVKGGVAEVRAGAGVVRDSVPALEADETRRKAESVLRALRAALVEDEAEDAAGRAGSAEEVPA